MTPRARHALAWITVQAVFALSGALALFVGVNNARCNLPDLFDAENGPFGRAADNGVEYQALFDIGRWAIIVGMTLGIFAVLFGMFVSWKNRVHLKTLLTFMVFSGLQGTVTIAVWSIQIEQHAFCGADTATIAASLATAVLLLGAIAFALSRTTWSSYDLATQPDETPVIPKPAGPTTSANLTSSSLASVLAAATESPVAATSGPLIIQMAGHGGAGKSTVARELASRLDATVLDLDVVKSELLDAGATWESASSDSYATIYRLVDGLLGASNAVVIVDTPSYWPEIHERLTAAAERHGARYAFVECIASPATRARRIDDRVALRSQAPASGANPRDAPTGLGDVHDRVVVAPDDEAMFAIDTDRVVDYDAIVARLT